MPDKPKTSYWAMWHPGGGFLVAREGNQNWARWAGTWHICGSHLHPTEWAKAWIAQELSPHELVVFLFDEKPLVAPTEPIVA